MLKRCKVCYVETKSQCLQLIYKQFTENTQARKEQYSQKVDKPINPHVGCIVLRVVSVFTVDVELDSFELKVRKKTAEEERHNQNQLPCLLGVEQNMAGPQATACPPRV